MHTAPRVQSETSGRMWFAVAVAIGGGTAFATWSGCSERGPQKK